MPSPPPKDGAPEGCGGGTYIVQSSDINDGWYGIVPSRYPCATLVSYQQCNPEAVAAGIGNWVGRATHLPDSCAGWVGRRRHRRRHRH
ncbi:hypothetical protein HYH03_014102 [Edaphochlamys debaryana]|uniref:Uncharacterized protein n=1 Tax=Edaphochlamys debaryana TaxID=47281 RepID=A0A835XNQ8_9CHLO|nr:hypothetical protein HYH03_014102 [Edaphochlamys debaryana]|eukprot:KAG2487261.1 hypothetical protein HYH03_014102 [Edaphochlamys debaryana]